MVSQLADLQAFADACYTVRTPEALHTLLQDITREMGFDHFALMHHVDLRPFGRPQERVVTDDFIVLSDYPQFWVDQYVSNAIVTNDPVLIASQKRLTGFVWEKIPELINVTAEHREITEQTRRAGLINGFTVPANIPGELNGSCHFAVATGHELPVKNLPLAQMVGSYAFQAARDLVVRLRSFKDWEPVKLTDRQLECLVLAARGKSDWEIGRILGISRETVKQHIADVRQRYDVPTRVQAVTRAMFDGHIPITEVLR